MEEMNAVELKAFVPAKDFELCKQFYEDLGFTKASDQFGVAYFHHGSCAFLLQDFYEDLLANNFMLHLLVEDVDAWHRKVAESGLAKRYCVKFGEVTEQAWGMRDFILADPSGVLWRIGQNN